MDGPYQYRRRSSPALLLLISLLSLALLASVNSPDSEWIGGIDDAPDHDEEVGVAASLQGVEQVLISEPGRRPAVRLAPGKAPTFGAMIETRAPPTRIARILS